MTREQVPEHVGGPALLASEQTATGEIPPHLVGAEADAAHPHAPKACVRLFLGWMELPSPGSLTDNPAWRSAVRDRAKEAACVRALKQVRRRRGRGLR